VLIIVLGVTSLISIYVKRVFKEYNKALKKEKEFFYERSIHDGLTGLYNRNYFTELLEKYIKLAKRENKKFAVLFLDLDNFKEINDTLSHKVGDYVLQIIAQRLKNVLRESDVVARFGGDEFVIGIFGFRENDDLEIIIQKIIDAIKQPIQYNNQTFEVTGSIGVAIYPKDGESVGKLIKNADAAMYKAKKEKGVFEFYTEKINEEVKRHMKLKQEIKEAIKNNEFVPYFQPQMDKEEKLYGSEVLVRWIKDGKIIPPFEFIPFAIEMGVIDQIDKLVIENALIQWKKWELKGYKPGVISCNITMQHVEKTDFLSFIKGLLNKYSFDPSMLNLEVTEQSVMQNPEESIKIFEKIRDLGIGINIDDFGTGYSSLSYLKKLPIDKLKIDKSFIDGIPYDNDDVKITTTIIALAKGLNLKIVAEGVENKIQRDFLIDHGCDYIQGYYYSPPISAEDFEKKYLKEENES
jgi:diguanylate cyclase (GGDEF)-like protein